MGPPAPALVVQCKQPRVHFAAHSNGSGTPFLRDVPNGSTFALSRIDERGRHLWLRPRRVFQPITQDNNTLLPIKNVPSTFLPFPAGKTHYLRVTAII